MIERPSGPPLCWASANANYSDALSDHQSIENQQQQQQQQQQQLQQHFGWIVVFFLISIGMNEDVIKETEIGFGHQSKLRAK